MIHDPHSGDQKNADDLDRLRPIEQQFYGGPEQEARRSKTGVMRVTSSSLKIPDGFVVERNKADTVPKALTLNKIALGVLILFLAFIGYIAWAIFTAG